MKKIRELEVQRETGTITGVNADTVEAWLAHWLPNIAARRVRERTLESYESTIRMHIVPHIGGQRLDKLQPEHLEQLYNLLLEQGLSPTSVLRVHRILSRALKVAMQRQRIHRNVAALVDPPAQKRSEVATALTIEEATAVLHAARGKRNEARWTVALALGLRQSEALALQWKDIDLLGGSLTVRRTIHRVKGKGLIYEEPKTSRSRRTLALPGHLRSALIEHKQRQTGDRMLAGSEWVDEDLVFAQPNGRPIDKKGDYKNWRNLLDRGRRAARSAARRAAHRGHSAAGRRRAPAGGDGAARPHPDPHHDGHLQPRDACAGTGSGRTGWTRSCSARSPQIGPATNAGDRGRTATTCNQSCNHSQPR